MLRRATALKRICDRQRVQNAEISNAISEEVLSLLLKEVIHAGERC